MKKVWLILLVVLFVAVVSCAPKVAAPAPSPTPIPQPQKMAPAGEVAAKPAWQSEWEKAVEAGMREGTVVVLSEGTVTMARTALIRTFKEKYDITLEWVAAPASQVQRKILAEQAAGLYLNDIYFAGAGSTLILLDRKALEPVGPLLVLPEVTDPNVWLGGKLPYFEEEQMAFLSLAGASVALFINTDLVKEGEITSFRDLLNPKWKGKIVMLDPTVSGAGQVVAVMLGARIMDWDYLREVARQMPVLTGDARQQTEWVARGKYPIAWGTNRAVVGEFIKAGAPLKFLRMTEGTYLGAAGGLIVLLKKAPHPNAVKVFANWVLTKEGQAIVQKEANYPSRRLDISKEGLDPVGMPQPGEKLVERDTAEFMREYDKYARQVREIFLPLVSK